MDPWFCVLLALAVCLEIFIESGRGALTPYVFGFSGDYRVPEGATAKSGVQDILRKEVFALPAFQTPSGGTLGSHSVRKFGRV
jgi:hypothetical protein